MVGRLAKVAWLCAALGAAGMPGLCASAPANSSVILVQAAPQGAVDMGAPGVQIFSVSPPPPTPPTSPLPPQGAPASPGYPAPAYPAPVPPAQPYPAPVYPVQPPPVYQPPSASPYPVPGGLPGYRPGAAVRIALLLPLRSDTLGQAAEAVRSGFVAAYEHDRSAATISIVPTGDAPQEILAIYADAVRSHDIIVGPLSRSGVAALAASGAVDRPTVALAHPESGTDAPARLPANMLAIGLSVEDEARQVAQWAYDENPGRALIVSTNAAWQRRAARAFAAEWQRFGLQSETLELTVGANGYLGAASLTQLKKRIQAEPAGFVFAALGAEQARQLRLATGPDLPLYGTSQLNALALPDWAVADPVREMNGVRLLDLPWQLQASHPAVMVYPRPVAVPGQRRDPDLERLYALGIDAYRIAVGIAQQPGHFELDGVTGRLSVTFGNGRNQFERMEQPALYVNGAVAPWASLH